MNQFLRAFVFIGVGISAFGDTLNLSTGVSEGATYTVVEQNSYNFDATAIASVVTPSDPDWSTVWIANSASSAWIAYDPDHCCDNGDGDYSTTFVLTPGDVSTVALSGFWTLDDIGSLYLNGHLIASLGDASWGKLRAFNVPAGSSDFVVGANTLSIDITLSDSFLEGVNLNGSLTGYTPVPEPFSIGLLIVGAGMLLAFARRHRSADRRANRPIPGI